AGIRQAVAVDVMGGGFDKPAIDILESATRALTFMIARQTDMQIELWGPHLRLVMVRARLAIAPRVDDFMHTPTLIDLGRRAGERLLAEHLDRSFRVRPGILEVTLPETVSQPSGVVAPSSDRVPTSETLGG